MAAKKYFTEKERKQAAVAATRRWQKKNPDKWKALQRTYNLRRQRKFQAWVRQFKNVPCADCGRRYHPTVMDFDHVRGKKQFCLGHSCNVRSPRRVLMEMKKCDVVCANCHRMRTWRRAHAQDQSQS